MKAMRLLYEEKNNYWRSEIAASKGDTRRLWWTFESVLGEVPTADTDDHTADEFAAFLATRSRQFVHIPHRWDTVVRCSVQTHADIR